MDCSGNQDPQWSHLWAKTNQQHSDRLYHPLLFHMLDVAAVAGLVWDHCLGIRTRDRLERSLGLNARNEIAFFSGAHDVGKASPGFQNRVTELSQHSGLPFSRSCQSRPHAFITAQVLKEELGPCSTSGLLGQISGGHHGVFPRSADLSIGRDTLGDISWKRVRQELLQEFARLVGFDLKQAANPRREITDPAIIPTLAGLISVVDWIGSNQDFFPCVAEYGFPPAISSSDYWTTAQKQARAALHTLGWLPAVTFAAEAEFEAVFSGLTPNGLQDAAIELASKQTSPYLMIVEAAMGQGKTEAALYAADMAMCNGFARGMYIAMPTQATGNAMFGRVLRDYLWHRGHRGKLNLQLVHGDALLARTAQVQEGEIPGFQPKNIGDDGEVEAQSWFTAKKRPLLAPFGVGTIDQSLLSVLQTKHWFVRLFGLAGKVLIFDEVHAYDSYMSTILERLLRWLAELDCTVILLSATLPEAKRRALAKAYSGRSDGEFKRYPRITVAKPCQYPKAHTDTTPVCVEIPMGDRRVVEIRPLATNLQTLTASLGRKLENGGCAAVVCNTIGRSIEVYEHLRANLIDTECSLFHARTLTMWRREIEKEVMLKFGKGENQGDGTYANHHRPARAVLVATQVIEQSLDLDFDLIVSEIAPVDLLLQRCGRLHRHLRLRPVGLETPRFVVLCDAEPTGPPPKSFGNGLELIYDRYVLLRTWLALRHLEAVEIPAQIEALVEMVYGDSATACDENWHDALEESRLHMEHVHRESEKAARRLLVCQPKWPGDLVEEFNSRLVDDEAPEVHQAVRAATREGDPSVTVVLIPEDRPLNFEPEVSEVRALLDRSAKLSHRGIYRLLLDKGTSPEEWAKNPHLRHARLLRYNHRNQTRIGNYLLTIDQALGVVIRKNEEKHG